MVQLQHAFGGLRHRNHMVYVLITLAQLLRSIFLPCTAMLIKHGRRGNASHVQYLTPIEHHISTTVLDDLSAAARPQAFGQTHTSPMFGTVYARHLFGLRQWRF